MTAAQKPAGHLIGTIFVPPRERAAYATDPGQSRGRFHPEPESGTRTSFQRDRDRIIHSTAFRRLKHKTQVFVQHEGDYYRTRLTHSLEVAQVARSAARVLALDEDLAEAVALAHDLGHTPFGHAGEEALDEATRNIGGFDHNAHALRLVTQLEHRYAQFDGLNLTWETLEGLVKHNGPLAGPLPEPIAAVDAAWPLGLSTWPGLEAQIAAFADDIAYINHDIDDGLRAGLFAPADLLAAPFAGRYVADVEDRFGNLELGRFIGEIVRRLMSAMIGDLLMETRRRLDKALPKSVAEVRNSPPLAGFGAAMAANITNLKGFLFERMYRHPQVMAPMANAQRVVTELFDIMSNHPDRMPPDWASACGRPGDARTGAVVRDYIAGMTDRFALEEHCRITRTEIVL